MFMFSSQTSKIPVDLCVNYNCSKC